MLTPTSALPAVPPYQPLASLTPEELTVARLRIAHSMLGLVVEQIARLPVEARSPILQAREWLSAAQALVGASQGEKTRYHDERT